MGIAVAGILLAATVTSGCEPFAELAHWRRVRSLERGLALAQRGSTSEALGILQATYEGLRSETARSDADDALMRRALFEIAQLNAQTPAQRTLAVQQLKDVARQSVGRALGQRARREQVALLEGPLADPAGATDALRRLLQEYPHLPDEIQLRLQRARLARKGGELDAAEEEARRVLEERAEQGERAIAEMVLGDVAMLRGQPAQAAPHYRKVLQLAAAGTEQSALARVELANCLAAAEQLPKAIETLKLAVDGHPNPDAIRLKIAMMESRLEQAAKLAPAGQRRGRSQGRSPH